MICQVDTIDFLGEKPSLRKPPHAFGSESVKKSDSKGLLKKTGMLLSNITVSWATKQEMLLIYHVPR